MAWRVRQPSTDLVVRVPWLELSQMPRPMSTEFDYLHFVPPDVGPQPVALMMDEGKDAIGCPCIVTTYVEGSIKKPDQWSDHDLANLADVIARLHQSTSKPVGEVRLDLVAECEQTIDWYTTGYPRVYQGATTELGRRVLAWLRAHAPCMASCHRVALVHGDLVATNVVFAAERPRFIDWEWAEFSDPAKDLVLIGGRVFADPWYVPLSAIQVDSFIDAYIDSMRKYSQGLDDHGLAPDTHDDLRERRAVWEIYERFASSLSFSVKAQTEKGTLYKDAVASVHRQLGAVLDEQGF